MAELTVSERMSHDVAPIAVDATLTEAARRMRVSGLGGLPVVEPGGRRCVGILTERDVVVRVLAEEREPRAVLVRDIATLKPITCRPDDTIAAALARMREHEVQRLPVVVDGDVVGVVSLADIVFARPDEERGALAGPEGE